MTNPLSRERLEYSLFKLEQSNIVDSANETIRSALSFLLNPEPTAEMFKAGSRERSMQAKTGITDTDAIFKAMISQLTRDE